MAEFLNEHQQAEPLSEVERDGFDQMGKPVPAFRMQAAYQHAKSIGLKPAEAFIVTKSMAVMLERDQPYEAVAMGMKYVDLTGCYVLIAVLLTAPQPDRRAHA